MVSSTVSDTEGSDGVVASKEQGQPSSQADGTPVLDINPQRHSRKRTKQGRYISDITLDEVLQFTDYPANSACLKLGLGLTSFKRLCRGLGIQSWPYKSSGSRPKGEGSEGMNRPLTHEGNGAGPRFSGGAPFQHSAGLAASPAGPNNASLPPIAIDSAPPGTPLSMRLELLRIMHFSTEMKNRVGFTIVDDAVVSSLYKTACEAYYIEREKKNAANRIEQKQQQQQPVAEMAPTEVRIIQIPQLPVQEPSSSPAAAAALTGVENHMTSSLP